MSMGMPNTMSLWGKWQSRARVGWHNRPCKAGEKCRQGSNGKGRGHMQINNTTGKGEGGAWGGVATGMSSCHQVTITNGVGNTMSLSGIRPGLGSTHHHHKSPVIR